MRVRSPAFENKAEIPRKYTCEGENVSPPIIWEEAPEGTESFVIVCEDPDAPGEVFYHWAAYDIPATMSEVPEGMASDGQVKSFAQVENDFGSEGWGGPCPPEGDNAHRYHFHIYALNKKHLNIDKHTDVADIKRTAENSSIDKAEIVGRYERENGRADAE